MPYQHKVLLIDNYDSFTYNLKDYLLQLNCEVVCVRHDAITIAQIITLAPHAIVLSPGPGRPEQAGICLAVVRAFADSLPILGVCLGHQCIALAMGTKIVAAQAIMHGKNSLIAHLGCDLFESLSEVMSVTRYHSLVVDKNSLASELKILAWTQDEHEEIMAIRHRVWPLFGVQFHPEAVKTEQGLALLGNFLKHCQGENHG